MTSLSRAPRAAVRARSDSLLLGARGESRHLKIPGLSKLRIGGSVGKAFEDLKKVKVAGVPIAAMGNPVTAFELESQKAGGDVGKAVKATGQDLVAGAKNVPAAIGISKALPGDTVTNGPSSAPGAPVDSSNQGIIDRAKKLLALGTPEAIAAAQKLFDAVGGVSGIIDKGTLALGAKAVADQRARTNDLQDQAVNYAKGGYDAKAPLRSKAIAQLQDDSTPDLGSVFSNPGNVYDRQKRGLPPLTTAPSAASQLTSGNALSNAIGSRVPVTPPATAAPQAAPQSPAAPVAPAGPNPQLLAALASQGRPGLVAAQPMLPLPPRDPSLR